MIKRIKRPFLDCIYFFSVVYFYANLELSFNFFLFKNNTLLLRCKYTYYLFSMQNFYELIEF